MASPCWICASVSQTLVTSYKGLLDASVTQKKYKDLKKDLLKIASGGGQCQETPVDVLHNNFMQSQYADAKSNTYWWPKVFEFENPGESSDMVFRMDGSTEVPGSKKKSNYATVQRKRRGEDPEETVFVMISSMLQAKKIPSFLIHGYKWNKWGYPSKLNKLHKLDGELDLLISLPGKCLISIEVKAASVEEGGQEGVHGVTRKAFEQCEKTLMYISKLSYNLFHDKNIPFIKVAALPNCSRADFVQAPICENCSKHVITKDELSSIEVIHKWFDDVTKVFQSHQMSTDYDGELHEKVIGRLLGPKCLMEESKVAAPERNAFKSVGEKDGKMYGIVEKDQTELTSEQITEKYGKVEKIHTRWFQLNDDQRNVIIDDQKLLWLTGEPGSGKTLLFWNKIEDILSSHCKDDMAKEKTTVIVIPGNGNDLLYKKYYRRLSQVSSDGDCDLCIENFCDDNPFRPYPPNLPTCNILPKIIRRYQENREKGVLHIFIDESDWVLKGTDHTEFEHDWEKLDLQRLGYVWVIQNPLITNTDRSEEKLPGFKKVHLKLVMRMTKEAVRFVSHMLKRELMSGHGVAGDLPTLYSMACVCDQSASGDDPVQCERCIHKRQSLLILKILKECKADWTGRRPNVPSISDIAILMTETHKKYVEKIMEQYSNKFHRDRKYKQITISYSSYFRGCEEKIVVIDLSDPAIKIENLMECLTRCVSRLFLLDTGIDHPDNRKDYKDLKDKILAATYGEAEETDKKISVLIRNEEVKTEEIDEEEMNFILKLK